MKQITKFASLAFILLVSSALFSLSAEIKLPAIFGDNMVLQQQSEAALWGWAKPNSSVRVTTSWNRKNYSAKSNGEGYWKLKVNTPAAGYTDRKSVV